MKARLVLASFLGLAGMAQAHEHIYQATLTGPNEATPNSSLGIGSSTVTLDLDLITMQVEIDFSGLAGLTTAAFLHAPTVIPLTGTAAVMSPALSASGFPLGVTLGTYDHTFDLTDAPGYDPAFITAHGPLLSDALNALIFSFADGKVYLDIQSSAFPSGEIRGFFTETPEPASTALIGLGGCAMAFVRRRERR
jgi:CHRD domain/PEP-CTERM motif